MGKTIYSDHPTLEEGAQVYFLSWERTDESYHGIRISARHGSMYHYEQDGTYWLRSERYPQGRRSVFTLEQGENGFDFRENETGKYLSYCNGYIALWDEPCPIGLQFMDSWKSEALEKAENLDNSWGWGTNDKLRTRETPLPQSQLYHIWVADNSYSVYWNKWDSYTIGSGTKAVFEIHDCNQMYGTPWL